MDDTVVIGREKEIAIISGYIRQKRHIIIFGEKIDKSINCQIN